MNDGNIMTCGTCKRSWNVLNTPTPAARCPFEYEHPPEDAFGLGDILDLGWEDGYSSATVTQVHKDGFVDLLRCYVHTGSFSAAGRHDGSLSVLAYLGFEEIKDVKPNGRWRLVRKGGEVR